MSGIPGWRPQRIEALAVLGWPQGADPGPGRVFALPYEPDDVGRGAVRGGSFLGQDIALFLLRKTAPIAAFPAAINPAIRRGAPT